MKITRIFLIFSVLIIFTLSSVSASDDDCFDNLTIDNDDSIPDMAVNESLNSNTFELQSFLNDNNILSKKDSKMSVDFVDLSKSPIDENNVSVNDYNNSFFRVKFPSKVSGNLSLFIDGKHVENKTITSKTHYMYMNLKEYNLNSGVHDWRIDYSGDANYKNASLSGTFYLQPVVYEKTTPLLEIIKTSVKTGDYVEFILKNVTDSPIKNTNLSIWVNNQYKSIISTNNNGIARFKMNFPADTYYLLVRYEGNEMYDSLDKDVYVDVSCLNSNILITTDCVRNGEYFSIYLKDENNQPISNTEVYFSLNYDYFSKWTDKTGKTSFKISESPGTYSLSISFYGDEYHNDVSKTVKLIIPVSTSINIGNNILLTKGYLRIYLKSLFKSAISKKTVSITIDGKKFKKTTNKEGVIVFNLKLKTGNHKIEVQFDGTKQISGSKVSKVVRCIKGDVKDPLKKKVPLKNGIPNVDYMPKNYIMADNSMTYTLTKAQYKSVLKRDSYCIYLKNYVPKYTFFKSKDEPTLNHIIKREKWNVIEKVINYKIVSKNKKNYWPKSVTVNLASYSFTYSEILDHQDTGYTCGPTSASMCSQVLKNYVCEKKLAKQAGSNSASGTSPDGIKNALEKNHFKCSFYSKSTFNKALKQLKKGGAAVIFHAKNHYVAILDISKNGKKVLIGNPAGYYSSYSKGLESRWLTVKHVKTKFSPSVSTGLIVKLNYHLKKSTKKQMNKYYSNMGGKFIRKNTHEVVW